MVTDDNVSAKMATMASQITKLKEANVKYKHLLKLAKERIENQENELDALRATNDNMKEQLENADFAPKFSMDEEEMMEESSSTIVRICQRVEEKDVIWALIDFKYVNMESPEPQQPKRFQKWKRFESEAELNDFIRRDTGEPLTLPPYSLSPIQSAKVQERAKQAVAQVTEEFRRFRVRSELQRKQADAQIRDLHSNNVQSATRRIEGEDLDKELEQARTDHIQLEVLKAEMAEQESRWKEAYDVLLAENSALKSSGSEALLAAQWRQRYETCLSEKDDLQSRLQMEAEKANALAEQRRKVDAGKYELKYRDLKESFRLYRKKAKEIFEAQQRGDVGLLQIAEKGSEDAKLSYIKNLMVNYLSSDAAVREHMEGAIGTVLKFTPDEMARIEKKKIENDSWF